MANGIIHFLLFGLFSSLFEPDLGLRLRIAGSLSRGLPSSGAALLRRDYRLLVQHRYRGDYRLPVQHSYRGDIRLSVKRRYRGITAFRCGIATGGITVFRSRMLPCITRVLANSGFAFEGTTVFQRGIATGGITVFRGRMLPLLARRRHDCLKLMLSAVCCDTFLTLWDLVSSVFEVSFWRKPLSRRH